ncbi:GGDEF domain-containing protein [Azonexus fungiphilus]|uniref:GGDEF domain-containing protein n=1 Tax=Azonexus fungiphilus TaxID=146940 RepID=UPI00156B5B81|nr:sensor domain-containing diguanylate cyclase [Azonexus fungiphilus]NHC07425.1 sensor domain-containing diguanylate cyclase [Azonexus fungiphilus]
MGQINEAGWRTTHNRQLLERLLHDLDARLRDDPPDEVLAIESTSVAWPRIKDCLLETLVSGDETRCQAMLRQLAGSDTPFMLFAHQFGTLRNLVLKQTLAAGAIDDAQRVMALFEEMEEGFAAIYLEVFLNRLGTRNHLRLSHIRVLSDKNLLSYFESHLEWMAALIDATRARLPAQMPELDPTRCQFGQWLHAEGLRLIRDRSHIEQIHQLHEAMHHVVAEVGELMPHRRASGPLYALLKKAETFSLELGNEISLLNSIVIMSVYSKDTLTGFLSRRFLDRVLANQMEIAKATESPFSVIMFDLDHFKEINDRWGHPTGDRALEHVAGIVRDTLRQSDLIFRYGGEEFLLVCPSTPQAQARLLADKLRQRIAASPLQNTPPIPLAASFGVVEVAPAGYEVVDTRLVHEVVAACDGKLYAAKRSGRNCVV